MTSPTSNERAIRALQRAMTRACFAEEPAPPTPVELRAYLERQGVDAEDIAALVEGPRRFGLYRKLVRHNPQSIVEALLERTRRRFRFHAPDAFDGALGRFLHEVGPRTAHLRDVPREFLDWARGAWTGVVPSWLIDHAEVELADFTVGTALRTAPAADLLEVDVSRGLVFASEARLLELGAAVHQMPDDATAEPEQRPVWLLVYRDDLHATRFFELSPMAGTMVRHLFSNASLLVALQAAAHACGHALDAGVLEGTTRLLAELGERGVLLGACEVAPRG